MRTELMSRYYNDSLAGHFKIHKIQELTIQKYYWLIFCYNIKTYVIGCDIYLVLKIIKYKFYSKFQLLLVFIY